MSKISSDALGRGVFAAAWSAFGAVLLVIVDGATARPTSDDLRLIPLGVLALVAAGLGARRVVDAATERAALLASLVLVGFAAPCVIRMVDLPLLSSFESTHRHGTRVYSEWAMVGIGSTTFVATLAVQHFLRRRSAAPRGPSPSLLRPDRVTFGLLALAILLLIPVLGARLTRPSLEQLRTSTMPHARFTVPELDASFGEEQQVYADEQVVVTVVRSVPLPKQIGQLTIDLRDGLGARPVPHVAVGGGEQLALASRHALVWSLCHGPAECDAEDGAPRYRSTPLTSVTLARFLRGRELSHDTRASDVRGALSPAGEVGTALVLIVIGGLAVAVRDEVRRRRVRAVSQGREGILQPGGLIESGGEHFTASALLPRYVGPVVITSVDDPSPPYRGARVASGVVLGTIEAYLHHHAESRLDTRVRVGVALALGSLPALAAGLAGQWVP
jgi:hypothetical protein